jgi:hypothetical protein
MDQMAPVHPYVASILGLLAHLMMNPVYRHLCVYRILQSHSVPA